METMLFQLRFKDDDHRERQAFVKTLNLEWEEVQEAEKRELEAHLLAAAGGVWKNGEEQEWFKVDWERVPVLVEQRRVFLKRGKAYVPQREQLSLVVAEFTKKLDEALEVCHRIIVAQLELTQAKAHISRSTPPRRRRPPCSYPRPPLAELHSTGRCILLFRRQH